MSEQPTSKDLLAELHRWHSLKGASCFRDAADEIERLRMAERLNVETVATFQKRIDFLERTIELVADGLAGVRNASDEDAVDVLRAALDGRVGQPPSVPLTKEEMPEPSLDVLKRVAARLRLNAPDTAPMLEWAIERIEELEATFDLRWKADMRAIKRWQEAHPGNDLTWPDHADMVVWMLEQIERPSPTKSDSFANAPLTGPGSRLEADLRAMGAGETEAPRCLCGRGKEFHPWRFCDNYVPAPSQGNGHG
jgi:hypothetical protein